MSQKQITALIIIFLYMIATIAIGLIVSKMKSKKKASQSNEDFLMAGKSLGPLTLAGTLFAANTGGASTTGIATNVFQYGLSALTLGENGLPILLTICLHSMKYGQDGRTMAERVSGESVHAGAGSICIEASTPRPGLIRITIIMTGLCLVATGLSVMLSALIPGVSP